MFKGPKVVQLPGADLGVDQLLEVAISRGFTKVIVIGANAGGFSNVDIMASAGVHVGEAVTMCEHAKLRAMGFTPDDVGEG